MDQLWEGRCHDHQVGESSSDWELLDDFHEVEIRCLEYVCLLVDIESISLVHFRVSYSLRDIWIRCIIHEVSKNSND